MHVPEPDAAHDPATQPKHAVDDDAPALAEYVPALHEAHDVLPALAEY